MADKVTWNSQTPERNQPMPDATDARGGGLDGEFISES